MHQHNIIKEFYLDEIILHPILNEFNSHLESERLLTSEKNNQDKASKKNEVYTLLDKGGFFSLLK